MKNSFILFFLVCLLQQEIHGYDFSHIQVKDGLSQSHVKAIIQDSYGFLWFGTKNGLNRYDGTSIKRLNCEDHLSNRGDNNISALFEDTYCKLWVGTDKGVFIYDPVREEFHYMDSTTNEGKQMTNWIADIQGDLSGNIWIIIPDEGVFRYKNENLYHYHITDKDNYMVEQPECICITKRGEVWIGTNRVGLFLYNEESDSFSQYITDKNGNTLKEENIFSICEYDDCIAIAIHEGQLKKYNPSTNVLSVVDAPGLHYTVLRDVCCFDDKELWVGTQAGLFIINEAEHKTVYIKEDGTNPYGLSDKTIYVIYKDQENGIWLGTVFGGVNYLPKRKIQFEKHIPSVSNPSLSLSSKHVRELAEDVTGNIWIGTDDEGINVLNPVTGEIKPFEYTFYRKENRLNTLAVAIINNQVWYGIFKKGMDMIQLPSGNHKQYTIAELNLDEGSVFALCEDHTRQVWLGNERGLYTSPRGKAHFERVTWVGHDWIYHIMEDKNEQLWIASMGNGVFRYNLKTNICQHYVHVAEVPTSLSSNSVSDIMQDSKGRIWFSTDRGGICLYNGEEDNFITYSVAEGLPDDTAYRILEDKKHNLWFGTNRGLVKFNPETQKVRVYSEDDGLLGIQFNYKSALKGSDGKFYFGSTEGLIAFSLEQEDFAIETHLPLYITEMRIYNEEITTHSENSPLTRSIIHTDKVILPHNRSTLSFDFAALNYASSAAIHYSYMMKGLDKDRIEAKSNRNITYAALPPGKYTFMVQAMNKDNSLLKTERCLFITILSPWWLSPTSYVLYTLLTICLICLGIYRYENRRKRKILESRRLFEIEKEKELYSAKIEFFTEIVHEVRTPLTLISGPLETILEIDIKDKIISKNLRVIAQNTKRLSELIGQLLDFRKVGASRFLLDFVMSDIVKLLKKVITRFEPTIIQQQKELLLHIPFDEPLIAAIDKEAFTKIISNLLSNALKYSHRTIRISLTKESTSFTVCVASDGDKIPEELSSRIFEPFFRINKSSKAVHGTGMGLSLARSLAELHKGRLYLDIHADINSFVLTLPLNQEKVIHLENNSIRDEYVQAAENTSLVANTGSEKYTILLAEDNEDMRTFIADKLRQRSFIVEITTNGTEALELLKARWIDIVVSDIIMPQISGFELCRIMKSDMELSHIPFIFLTAKNDLESKINSLKIGADAYVEKPFSFSYLEAQIMSLLNNRKKEWEAFSKRPFFPVHNMKVNKADEEFMDKIIHLIHENITDHNFNVERLAEILSMSRSNLLRKIKALTGLSPVDFIRLIRLKKAAELIQEGKYRIGEIGYMVGINSPSYFSKLFFNQFGVSPKDFEKQNQFKKK
jgi:ligand-binding sensor domain-containing protein/signal transduction histidine kinase/DNA-binding response OmpR family regulator